MDWQRPERVFGIDLGPLILHALWRTDLPMTGAQISRVINAGTTRGVQYAMERLVELGLVDREPVGASLVHTLNRDHLMYPALDAAFREMNPWQRLVDRVTQLVTESLPEAHATVAVFGSVARGDARTDSDVDLLVIVPTLNDQVLELRDALAHGVRRWTGQPAGIYLTTPERLATAIETGDPIIESFRADARTLAGPDVNTYLGGRP